MTEVLAEFPAPENFSSPDLLIIAGEHSGDQHAARLVKRMKVKAPNLRVCAFGGPELRQSDVDFIYDMMAHSVVGFVEVLKHYKELKAVFNNILTWIDVYRPKAICFVDYPGFNLRLAQELFNRRLSIKGGGTMQLFYYIAPQVWAWKPKRRFKMAKTLDALGVIFPFESSCFSDTDLPTSFVGHPLVDEEEDLPIAYDGKGPLLLLPGSRRQAVSRIFPVMLRTFAALLEDHPDERALVIYPNDSIRDVLLHHLDRYPALKECVALEADDPSKRHCAKFTLTSSGTMSLVCALAGIPGLIVYRANPLTYLIGRILVNIQYLGIANILLDEEVMPEFIQGNATVPMLLRHVKLGLEPEKGRQKALEVEARLRKLLACPKGFLSADEWLLFFMKTTHHIFEKVQEEA
ncbi:MAG: lipid-A-disaccharide synthase [Opitutales bacterium]